MNQTKKYNMNENAIKNSWNERKQVTRTKPYGWNENMAKMESFHRNEIL